MDLPEELREQLWEKYKYAGYRFYWKGNKEQDLNHWNCSVIDKGSKNRESITNLEDFPLEYAASQIASFSLPEKMEPIRVYVNAYTFGTEGGIHKDSEVEGDITTIIYLNPEWKGSWGGETVVFNEEQTEILSSFLPKPGAVHAIKSNNWHCARGLSRLVSDFRLVLVIKWKRI